MRVFFGTLRIMISQMSYDIYIWFYDSLIVFWDYRYDILKRFVVVISVIVTLLFDGWIFVMLFWWAEHPLVLGSIVIGTFLMVILQMFAWIDRKKIYKWFLNRWSRASQTYRRKSQK